jgi:maltose alpha-D-glucosyltransferase/alpha-amylase
MSQASANRDSPQLLQVFLCHSSDDKRAVRDWYRQLQLAGTKPWLDEEDILIGQEWNEVIRKELRRSHVIIIFLSRGSVKKEGYVQKEITHALNLAQEKPEGTIFVIPARLEECELPSRLTKYNCVDLFLPEAYERLMRALQRRAEETGCAISPLPDPVPKSAFKKTEVQQLPLVGKLWDWESLLHERDETFLSEHLGPFIETCRWFKGKARKRESVRLADVIPVHPASELICIILADVKYVEGDVDTYIVPLAFASGETADRICSEWPHLVVARLPAKDRRIEGILYEATPSNSFSDALLKIIEHHSRFKGKRGELSGSTMRTFWEQRGDPASPLHASRMEDGSNTCIIYGERMILKLFRSLEPGVRPEVEMTAFLTEHTMFRNFPPLAGTILYRRGHEDPTCLAMLQAFVQTQSQADGWAYTASALHKYFEEVLARDTLRTPESISPGVVSAPLKPAHVLETASLPRIAQDLMGSYIEWTRLLGQRTAEFHNALASDPGDPNFAPEPFSAFYVQTIYEYMRNMWTRTFQLLHRRLHTLEKMVREDAEKVLRFDDDVYALLRAIREREITATRTRIHGDYHLGQVLYTRSDLVISNFGEDPSIPSAADRRIKHSPLRDVAGMLRSFHYAAYSALAGRKDRPALGPWARYWQSWVSSAFLNSYFLFAHGDFLPHEREELVTLLEIYILEQINYELIYELNNRPDWARIPLEGILQVLSC